jgi:tetratricopeptide (TPR) repeat protein
MAHRQALKEFTRERFPLDWAQTQNFLGNALAAFGERESGTQRLEEAVAAHRSALHELTRERLLLDWAATQYNLGNALRRLGEQERGTQSLEEAVDAYREALTVRTPEHLPLDCAMTQSDLGNALAVISVRRRDPSGLREALIFHATAWAFFDSASDHRASIPAAALNNDLTVLHRVGLLDSVLATLPEERASVVFRFRSWASAQQPT